MAEIWKGMLQAFIGLNKTKDDAKRAALAHLSLISLGAILAWRVC